MTNTLILLLSSAFFFVSALSAPTAASEPVFPFHLRAWRHWRAGPPLFDFQVEINGGISVVNNTAPYPGFLSLIEEGEIPKFGKLYRSEGEKKYAYLKPSATEGLYGLHWADSIPNTPGVLSSNFTRVPTDCGGNCGGTGLKYDLNGAGPSWGRMDTFFVEPKTGEDNVWTVGWTKNASENPIPAGAYSVIVWATGI